MACDMQLFTIVSLIFIDGDTYYAFAKVKSIMLYFLAVVWVLGRNILGYLL